MLSTLLLTLVLACGAVLALTASRPPSFHLSRSILIQAPPARPFALVSDFRRWCEWSPWEDLDPAMRREYGGAPSGVDSTYGWQGNSKTGAGVMRITAVEPDRSIVIRLEFTRPFAAVNTAEFAFQPRGDATEVTWSMHGPLDFKSRLIGIFFSMERMVGPMFEKGLAALKVAAERG